jgi:hypothetical protein
LEGQGVLQATRLSPPFCVFNLVGRARALEGHESSKLPGSAYLSVFSTRSGGPGHWKGKESSKLPGSAHLSVFSTWSGGLGHRMGTESSKLPDPSPLFCATNPNNLSGLEPFQEGRTLNSSTTTSPSRGHSVTRQRLLQLHN